MRKTMLIFLDVDGTLTDGKIYYSETNDEIKGFNIKDGLILSTLVKMGYKIVVITGRESNIVKRRMNELGVTEVYQGVSDKYQFFLKYVTECGIDPKDICYIGDDLNDLSIMKKVGMKACPADACKEVKAVSDYVAPMNGGDGAVRDILEHYLSELGQWQKVIDSYV